MAPSLSIHDFDKIELRKTRFNNFTTLTLTFFDTGVPVAEIQCYTPDHALEIITLEPFDLRSTTHEQAAT